MSWTSPFIIYRITVDAKVEEVFRCEDLKKAKYWLAYIAEPGDVLCKTPAHPKHSKTSNAPEYWSHKEKSGSSVSNEREWRAALVKKGCAVAFPDTETGAAAQV